LNRISARQILSGAAQERVENAIRNAEMLTSAEIRLFAEDNCREDVMDHAAFIFGELRMQHTKDRNGVLIYIAFADKKMAVIGDAGIHVHVHQSFWNQLVSDCLESFKLGEFVQGLETLIASVGKALNNYFPRKHDDVNELSDSIDFGGDYA
jgi:uncharacterized membrane protein